MENQDELERIQNEILQHKNRIEQYQNVMKQEENQVIAKIGIIQYIKQKEVENERDNRTDKGDKKPNTKSDNKTVPKK